MGSLAEFKPVRSSNTVVDRLPDDIKAQLIEARVSGSHTVPEMVAWLRQEGFTDVQPRGLNYWFSARGYAPPFTGRPPVKHG
jgi:hypothetical protein